MGGPNCGTSSSRQVRMKLRRYAELSASESARKLSGRPPRTHRRGERRRMVTRTGSDQGRYVLGPMRFRGTAPQGHMWALVGPRHKRRHDCRRGRHECPRHGQTEHRTKNQRVTGYFRERYSASLALPSRERCLADLPRTDHGHGRLPPQSPHDGLICSARYHPCILKAEFSKCKDHQQPTSPGATWSPTLPRLLDTGA